MKKVIAATLVVLAGASLAGCSTNRVSGLFSRDEPAVQQDTVTSGTMSAGEIRQALAGKNWRWQGPNNSGMTIFAADGTSLVEVNGKGTTTGKWEARDGQLCESFAPAPFLPGGVPLSCKSFSGSGSNFRVGEATFSPA